MISAIYNRRSIRKFLNTPILKQDIVEIIQSGIKAPSSKNRQPWKFVVMQGREKEEMLDVFRQRISREEKESTLLPQSRQHIAAAKYTANIMADAPVIVLVVNTLGKRFVPVWRILGSTIGDCGKKRYRDCTGRKGRLYGEKV